MKILYLALLALLSTDGLVNCTTKQSNTKPKTTNPAPLYNPPIYNPPVSTLPVVTGGLKYTAPVTTKPAYIET